MAVQNTYIGVEPRTVIADSANATIAIGVRVIITLGLAELAGATARGDFVTLTSIEPGQPGKAISMQSARNMFFTVAGGVTIAVDDLIYSAANGLVTNSSSGGAIYIGNAITTGVAGGFVQVEMQNPA